MTTRATRPTMRDVAQHARVALKTVSRVVNGEPGVRAETVERVQTSISQLGYRRNDSARVLRRGQTASIGLILENIGDPFYATLSRAVEDVAARHDTLLITGSSDDPRIYTAAQRYQGYRDAMTAAGLPVPPVLPVHPVLPVPPVPDGAAPSPLPVPVASAGTPLILPVPPAADGAASAWVTMASPTSSGVKAALRRMLTGPAPVTAVFCGNNRVTVLALRELREARASVALVGFDDLELADLLEP